jgi:hypothetical protein
MYFTYEFPCKTIRNLIFINNDNGVEEGEEDNNDNVDSGRIMGVMTM